jgi:uncharacterized SAM-binding protein YcdF (DUF218 family)
MFFFKKLIGPLLAPYPVFLGLLGLGVLMIWFSSRRRLANILVTIATVGFCLLSYPALWDGLVGGMEFRYRPLDTHKTDLSGIRWVVVLGGGGTETAGRFPATGELSPSSLARLVEGVRILRSVPQGKLLVSGNSDGLISQDAAQELGVNPDQIVVERKARDTEEQAVEIKKIVRGDRLVLVTSALHMPRSMGLFAKQGMVPIPAPADFTARPREYPPLRPGEVLLPNSENGSQAGALFHEWLGIAWAILNGHIQATAASR